MSLVSSSSAGQNVSSATPNLAIGSPTAVLSTTSLQTVLSNTSTLVACPEPSRKRSSLLFSPFRRKSTDPPADTQSTLSVAATLTPKESGAEKRARKRREIEAKMSPREVQLARLMESHGMCFGRSYSMNGDSDLHPQIKC